MYCPNCGKQIDDKAALCVGCGVPVAANADIYPYLRPRGYPYRGEKIFGRFLGIITAPFSFSMWIMIAMTSIVTGKPMIDPSGLIGLIVPFGMAAAGLALSIFATKHKTRALAGIVLNAAALFFVSLTFVLYVAVVVPMHYM